MLVGALRDCVENHDGAVPHRHDVRVRADADAQRAQRAALLEQRAQAPRAAARWNAGGVGLQKRLPSRLEVLPGPSLRRRSS